MQKHILFIAFLLLVLSAFAQKKDDDYTIRVREQNEIEYESNFIEASKQKLLGNYNVAMDLFLKCLKINPQSTVSMYEMARLFYTNNDVTAAVTLMETAISINPSNEWYNLLLLQIYKQKKQYAKAEEICNNLIKKNPSYFANYYELASLYLADRRYNKAQKTYKQIEANFGTSTELSEEKIKFYIEKRDLKSSKKQLKQLIAQNPDEEKYYSILIDIHMEQKQIDSAIFVAKLFLQTNPDAEETNIDLFKLYYTKLDSVNALSQLRKLFSNQSISIDEKSKLLIQILSENKMKCLINAQDELTQILITVHPEDIKAHFSRADYCVAAEKIDEAKTELTKILSKDKSNIYAYEHLLRIESQQDNWQNIYTLSTQALQYYPVNAMLYFYAGISAYQIEKYNESIDNLLTGVTYCATDELKAQFYMYLGESYYKLKDYTKCYHFFDRSISTNPTNDVALNNYSYYLSLMKDSLGKALDMTKISNKLKPNNSVYLDTYAWVLFKLEKYNEAKIKIEEALKFGGDTVSEIVEHYGDILFKNGEKERAVATWIKAKSLGSSAPNIDNEIKLETYIEQ